MQAAYIHIPFCRKICTYCDFCKVFYDDTLAHKYLVCLEEEINEQYNNEILNTIYIGGGTPSALSLVNLEYLFLICSKFRRSRSYEFTFECNIEDISENLLDILKKNGVNRLSIGIQSFNKKNLRIMGRNANFKDTVSKIKLCRAFGFTNINIDLIYALPGEAMFTLKRDIAKILKLNVEHISTYSLILEKHTVLYNKEIKNIPEKKDAKMYDYIRKVLKKHGYNHYEVSNFAREGYEAKHNKTYWLNQEYYGFGCGAHGYVGNIRYANTMSLTKYLSGDFTLEKNLLSKQDEMDNEIMLGLRLLKGIDEIAFQKKYGLTVEEAYPNVEALIKSGLLIRTNNYISIPEDYIYTMNSIIIKII